MKRVVVAMSGGVDSSVAAALMHRQGYEVIGVTMTLSPNETQAAPAGRGCCSVWDVTDAEKVAWKLGIPHYAFNLRDEFRKHVIDDFLEEYARGRTPNPCRRCNQHIKFDHLMQRAQELGADKVVTGHYARIREEGGRFHLLKGLDASKDQSYVLASLTQAQLSRSLFPIGELAKSQVRDLARELGLDSVANKPESMDLCFIPDGDTRGWLGVHLDRVPGEIVDESGEVLGEHDGALGYTVGQRRGLAIGRPAPDGNPRYVLSIRPVSNQVVVGSKDRLAIGRIAGGRYSLTGDPGFDLAERFDCDVQIRAHADPVPATARLVPIDEAERTEQHRAEATHELVVDVDLRQAEPLLGVAPGQSAVLYRGTRVLGQFTIDRAMPAAA